MKTINACAFLTLFSCFSSTVLAEVTFNWATVGNPGNAPDSQVMSDGTTGYGSVDYTYRISKHEVTNAQYTEFLNAVDPTGANANLGGVDGFLYDPLMSTNPKGSGININVGAAIGSKYEIQPGRGDKPVAFASFFDSMRFVNWLENGQAGGSTESGVYTIGSGIDEVRNPNATHFIPSEDEWYKAAYHKNNGVTGDYWDFATSTDTVPFSDNPNSLNTPDDTNVANFRKNDGIANGYDDGFAVTGRDIPENVFLLTGVGAYSLSVSPYGTFDQSGNLLEWTEGLVLRDPPRSPLKAIRGGQFQDNGPDQLRASSRGLGGPQRGGVGFRVASTSGLLSDLTNNGFVDFEDLTVLLANWNKEVTVGEGNLVNADTTPVNFEDLTVLLADWTGPGPGGSPEAALGTEAVPEPSAFVIAALGILGLFSFTRRRRL